MTTHRNVVTEVEKLEGNGGNVYRYYFGRTSSNSVIGYFKRLVTTDRVTDHPSPPTLGY